MLHAHPAIVTRIIAPTLSSSRPASIQPVEPIPIRAAGGMAALGAFAW